MVVRYNVWGYLGVVVGYNMYGHVVVMEIILA
jgi:hypothetical protein